MTQTIDSQAAKIASLEQQLAGIQAALVKLQPKDQLVAQLILVHEIPDAQSPH